MGMVPLPPTDHPDFEKIALRHMRNTAIMHGIVVGAAIIGIIVVVAAAVLRTWR